MEDDNQEGPFAMWQMFNVPTMVLFANLETATDGLDRLLTSILKLSGDFSEVLVPRPCSSKYPDEYYKAFNTWLIGRLFYVWSVQELERIHVTSKEAQLKILNILCVNSATFYDTLHFEYFRVLEKLNECYNQNVNEYTCELVSEIELVNFSTGNIEIPNSQIDLSSIYVHVKDIKTCETLIDLTLQLLAESIPTNTFLDRNKKEYESLYSIVLHMLENYNIHIKLICLKFFQELINKSDKMMVSKFCESFSTIYKDLLCCIEALVISLPMYYEKCAVGELYLDSVCYVLLNMIKDINKTESRYKEVLSTLCGVILNPKHEKIFNKQLKHLCLSFSFVLELPESYVCIKNKDATEINILQAYYTQNVVQFLKINSLELLKDNSQFEQLTNAVVESMEAAKQNTVSYNIDKYLLLFQLNKAKAALETLQNIYFHVAKTCESSGPVELLTVRNSSLILNYVRTIKEMIENMNDFELTNLMMDLILAVSVLSQNSADQNLAMSTKLLNFTEYKHDKVVALRYNLVVNILQNRKLNETYGKTITTFVSSLICNKSSAAYKQIFPLCPLLLLQKAISESKLIGDIFMPAFFLKDSEIQKEICNILPAIACISLGSYVVILQNCKEILGHTIFFNDIMSIAIVCSKCHNTNRSLVTAEQFLSKVKNEQIVLHTAMKTENTSVIIAGLTNLFAKFLNSKMYMGLSESGYLRLIESFSNHTIFNQTNTAEVFSEDNCLDVLKLLRPFFDNISVDEDLELLQKQSIFKILINLLVYSTRTSLQNTDYNHQTYTLNCIKEFGISTVEPKVLLPSTKLLIYFIMHPQCTLGPKAVVYLRAICEAHNRTPNQVYHRYKKDYCKLFVECSLFNGKEFAMPLLKAVRAFGFAGYRDFISKDVHHFLPYLIPYSVKMKEIPSIIEEIASLVQCSVSDFLIDRFPHIYTHIYLYENGNVSNKCYELVEKLTKVPMLNLIKRHFRIILTEFLLQYCCNPEKVLNACRYLACHDPDVSTPTGNMTMTTSQVADFLQPKFLGVLAYFDHKLVNAKVALSVKRTALQSFPDIMQLMGDKHLTPLRFKVLATLRSAMSLIKEFPKILTAAWSAFIHNIDSISLGPLLPSLAVSLLQQLEHAPHEVNKIFQYLVLSNENLLSSQISDLFFLEDTKVSEKVKLVVRKHVKRTQPEGFLDKVKWYLQHLNQEIPTIKATAFSHLDKLLKSDRTEIHKAIFGGKNIDPVIIELIDCLLIGCKDPDGEVSLSSGACLGQLGAIEAGHLPRQYVQPDGSPFAFTISEDCFAATALIELSRAFQYEKDTMNMDCYALTIQEILKIYNISPNGNKKDVWDSFPEHMHQIMFPLLSSRYTLAYPSQPKKAHPLFGSTYATTFLEWAHNWAGQLIPLIDSESIRELLRTVHPSMRRDVRTLFLFLPYVLLHAIMSKTNPQYILEEMLAVIGLENLENDNRVTLDRSKYKLLRNIQMTPSISTVQAEEGSQSKYTKMIYTLLDFLNRWLLEWCHSKQHPLQNENYKAISTFIQKFDKLTIARGNFMCGEFERSLQYLELYMDESKDQMQNQLPFLAEIYALLDEPDSVAGILTIKRSEPSIKELILAQVVTGRLQDAALCYERLAQEGQLERHSLQGMIDCYLSLDQPFTAYRLLSEHEDVDDNMLELAAEPLWRLGRFEQLDEIARKPVPPSRENWGLLMGRILLDYRRQIHVDFDNTCRDGMIKLLSQMDGESKGENALRSGYQSVLGLHIIQEARHSQEVLQRLKTIKDGDSKGNDVVDQLLNEWRRRLSVVQSDVRTVEPLLRLRRILLQQTQELLEPSHPLTAIKIKSCIGDLWLQSAKHARKAGIFQQSYMYILNAEEYRPEQLFIEKSKMYWARGLQEQAFTTLKRGLDDGYPHLEDLTQEQRKICAKAKLLIAKYNDETTNVDVDVNIGYYKEAVDACRQWEKSLVCLGAYYEKISSSEVATSNNSGWSRRIYALNSYGKALQYGHKYLYQSMPRMLSIWLDVEVTSSDANVHTILAQMTEIIKTYSERLPLYLYLTAYSQIVSRICHPVKEVYQQLKAILVKLILAYPQHTLWMTMCVIKSSYPQRMKRCQDVFADPRLKEPHILRLVCDFTLLAEKLIELCNKPMVDNSSTTTVSALVRTLPRLLASENFSHIMMPFQEFCKIVLPSKAARQERIDFNIPSEPPVYIAGIEERITILPSLQKPRKVTLKVQDQQTRPIQLQRGVRQGDVISPKLFTNALEDFFKTLDWTGRGINVNGSDGKSYIIMLKPRDDLRKDYRLMEFNAVVNRFLQDAPETRRRRLYIRTYSVLPLNEECGLIEWVPNLVGLRPVLMHIYKQKGIHTSNRELKEMMCANKDPVEKKRRIYEERLLPRHPPVFQEWFRRVFSDPYGWYQARSAYIRTTAVMSMVGYILGLGDRHGENISFDSTNGDTVHVDFNCLFNKGEAFEWPERVPFRLTHNMEAAMGPLKHEGMFRKSCEAVMKALRAQTAALMSVIGPFVYDPLVSWGRARPMDCGERTNEQALQHLQHIRQRLNGMVRTKNKQLSLSLSSEGQVEHLIVEATSVHNLCQMYIGWGPFL